ncbi:MAG: hypothetical protein CL799_10575 [Chromatiales bacterium]|nr:hypothetical protein [Chromatiales bacterium]
MKARITSLPIRSSPTRRSLFRTASLPALHTSATLQAPPHPDTMLARAYKEHQANPPPRNPLSKQLFPSSSPAATADIRDQFKKPGTHGSAPASARTESFDEQSSHRWGTSIQRGHNNDRLAALCGSSGSFSHRDDGVIDLTGPQGDVPNSVELFADDFDDDADLDLDFEMPNAMPAPAPNPAKNIDPVAKENIPPSSVSAQEVPWSSSPPAHWLPPKPQRSASAMLANSLKRESSGENDSFEAPAPKKRVLPWKRAPAEDDVTSTPAQKHKKNLWEQSESAVKESKRQLKNQRQPSKAEVETEAPSAVEGPTVVTKAFSLSKEQKHVMDLVVNRGQSVFFTGAAGTGKSVLMRAIIEELKKKYARDPERVAVTASTGLAACNIGGTTLHSFSGIGLGKDPAPALIKKIRRNPKAKNRWLKVKCLIIDEVSMVDGDLFDKLSQIGRTIRNNGRPWGGIQLIITGDFFQLPPVPEKGGNSAKDLVKFAFDASTWNTSIDHTIGLTEVFRQRDPEFARMLNEMRVGKISPETERSFKALSRPLTFEDGVEMAQLYPTRSQVEASNENRLRALPGQPRRYEAIDTGDPQVRDKVLANMMSPKTLDLKIGAQVMLIKNLNETLVNGTLGKVIAFSDEKAFEMQDGGDYNGEMDDAMAKARRKLASFKSKFDPEDNPGASSGEGQLYPVVKFLDVYGTAKIILCQPEEWKVELPNGEVQARRSQLPLILAWALSIHKAQGQTLERVTVDLGKVFEKGQAYVALSRATSQHGLQVKNFNKARVMAHPKVVQFYDRLYSAEEAARGTSNSMGDFIANKKGAADPPAAAKKKAVDLSADEEAMASFGF